MRVQGPCWDQAAQGACMGVVVRHSRLKGMWDGCYDNECVKFRCAVMSTVWRVGGHVPYYTDLAQHDTA